MNQTKLYETRDFGALFNAVFAFIRQEFKALFAALLYVCLPVILIGSVINGFLQGNILSRMFGLMQQQAETAAAGEFEIEEMSQMTIEWFAALFGSSLISFVLYSCIGLTIHTYVKLRSERDLAEGIRPREVWDALKSKLLSAIGAVLLFYLCVVLGGILCIIPGVYVAVVLSLFLPVMVIEGKGVLDAFQRSNDLIKQNWWLTFGFFLLISFLASLLVSLLYIPPYILAVLSFALGMNDVNQMLQSLQENMIWIVTAVYLFIQFASLISQGILHLAIAFQYGNLREQKEGIGLQQEIDLTTQVN